jgi:peptide/nickel transport system permease protein
MRRRLPRSLTAGAALTGLIVGAGLLSLVWTPVPPGRLKIADKLKGPLEAGLLGADHLGRDTLSMLMAGAANSLFIAVLAVLLGGTLGILLGLVAASRKGLIEAAILRVCDAAFALPPVLSAILLGAVLGGGRMTAVVAIALFMVPVFARVARAAALQVMARDYILAARMLGLGRMAIARDHVLPNIAGPLAVQATLQLGLAILSESGLSFLGLGPAPPAPSWGRMLADAQTYLAQAPHLALAPGLAIAAAILGLNLLGDGLATAFDPRRARRSA